jgi:hypothetical protein
VSYGRGHDRCSKTYAKRSRLGFAAGARGVTTGGYPGVPGVTVRLTGYLAEGFVIARSVFPFIEAAAAE